MGRACPHFSESRLFPLSKKREREREKAPQSTCMGIIDFEAVEEIFSGPYSSRTSRQYKKKTGWLTVAVRLNGKNEETILQPAWAVWGYLLSNVLLLLSSHNRTKSDLVWIWVLGTLGLIDSTIIILRPPFFFLSLRNFVCRRFQNNWIEPREGAAPSMNHGEYLNSSYWQLLRVQLVFGQSLNYFQAVKLWMRMRN